MINFVFFLRELILNVFYLFSLFFYYITQTSSNDSKYCY